MTSVSRTFIKKAKANEMRRAKVMRKKVKKNDTSITVVKAESSSMASGNSAVSKPLESPSNKNFYASKKAFIITELRYIISKKYNSERQLFLNKNSSDECSLIVEDVPPYITLTSLGRILAELGSGTPEEITLRCGTAVDSEIIESYYSALARFKSEYAVEQALQRCEMISCLCLSDINIEVAKTGVLGKCQFSRFFEGFMKFHERYRKSYKTVEQLQEGVDSYIEKHDKKIIEEKKKAKRMANVPDEEGWITVTKSHYKAVPRAIVVKNKEDLLRLTKKKKREETDIAFYSFQLKQSRMKHLDELRQKFEEDKRKLAIVKAARKFRPT
ncbi:unnamed protein product [Thelazia callipaeda]|uniref:RRP7 domain-containing protein n=1 Tax=Thelazia callipaeda TaxID=103827 RepID=A0A0N5CLC9_THECL|nr:unnamed protein product [Thelazia callipaeda]